MNWTQALPYFPLHELACKGSGVVLLDLRFAAALPALREAWGSPLSPSSVCRSPEHNKAEGGHPRSMHLTVNPERGTNGCMAADLRWRAWSAADRLRMARLAWRMGWSVGLHDGFIHVDWRAAVGLPRAVFLYGSWSGFSPDEVTA